MNQERPSSSTVTPDSQNESIAHIRHHAVTFDIMHGGDM
jgi:hypothetical protein